MAIPIAKLPARDLLQIEVQSEEQRPFELGDLLTREFAARNSSFLISLAFHTLMVLLLSLVLIHSTGKAMIMLDLMSSPDIEEFSGVIAEVEVDITELEKLVAAVDEDPFNAAFGDLDGDEQVIDNSQIAADAGGGEQAKGKGDGKSAKFFGMRALGNKFVYVLDRSGSMAYESPDVIEYKISRFDVARMELMNSVESLQPHQEFYVVLFSNRMEQMFDRDDLIPTAIKATSENKARLKEWLWKDQAIGGTDPRSSLKLAFKMNPDAIFMLSDGEFRDERQDGKPLSIDIARQQMEEIAPIRINSIALEDDASKANMAELSELSGGQFKFVKVKDYISRLALSPADLFQSRVPDESQIKMIVSWKDRFELSKRLINLLNSQTTSDRVESEKRLHELTFGVFEHVIPSVASPDVDAESLKQAAAEWTQVWKQADEQTDLDPSTSTGLFSTLAAVGNKDFLESVKSLGRSDPSPLDQIAIARSIVDYQRRTGAATKESTRILLDYLRELNKESKASFSEDSFVKRATVDSCERRLETVLKNRRLRASRLFGKTRNKSFLIEVRTEFAKDLIALYPETAVAQKAAKNLNIPVSLINEIE